MSQKTINITGVSLCKKAGRIRIFHSTIKRLGEPKYIRFLFNQRNSFLRYRHLIGKIQSAFMCQNVVRMTGTL